METKRCVDCGKEEIYERRRCRECALIYNRERAKKIYQKNKEEGRTGDDILQKDRFESYSADYE